VIENIEPIPKIPQTLRLAALQRKLIPFVGAGVSQLGGCPGWDQFANGALQFFVGEGKLSPAQFDQIRSLSSRVKLSLALELEVQHGISIDFKNLLVPSDEERKRIGDSVYLNLSRLATMFVTTNYDDWLDRIPPAMILPAAPSSSAQQPPATTRHRFCKHTDMTVENWEVPHAVFHIHGSVHERESMALTTVDYLVRYSGHRIDGTGNRENPLLTFLQKLFGLKNVLFIGYGLNELELLEYVIQKGVTKGGATNEEPRHYVLQGFFSHEIEVARALESYFCQFGIGLLPFSRDQRDWDQLAEVISYFSTELPPGPALALSERMEMEGLLP
jgi:SIR2-like domain